MISLRLWGELAGNAALVHRGAKRKGRAFRFIRSGHDLKTARRPCLHGEIAIDENIGKLRLDLLRPGAPGGLAIRGAENDQEAIRIGRYRGCGCLLKRSLFYSR